MGVLKQCPMCGAKHELKLTKEQSIIYQSYLCGAGKIQEMLPELGPVEREFLMTGYCYKCQSLLFGNTNKPNMDLWA